VDEVLTGPLVALLEAPREQSTSELLEVRIWYFQIQECLYLMTESSFLYVLMSILEGQVMFYFWTITKAIN